jgi:hypothetical protein
MLFALGLGAQTKAPAREGFSGVMRSTPPALLVSREPASHSDAKKGAIVALTGQYQFRRTFAGKVVLQVEEEVPTFWLWVGQPRTKRRWRDATLMDLSAPALRILLDWRFKPSPSTQVEGERTGDSAAQMSLAASR